MHFSRTLLKTVALTGLWALLVAFPGFVEAEEKEDAPPPEIVFCLIENLSEFSYGHGRTRVYRNYGELDRFHQLGRVLEEAMEEEELELRMVFERFPPGPYPPEIPRVTIILNKWELNRLGEYEARFAATLHMGEEKTELGFFVGRYHALVTPMRSLHDQAYRESAKRAVKEMLTKAKPLLKE